MHQTPSYLALSCQCHYYPFSLPLSPSRSDITSTSSYTSNLSHLTLPHHYPYIYPYNNTDDHADKNVDFTPLHHKLSPRHIISDSYNITTACPPPSYSLSPPP